MSAAAAGGVASGRKLTAQIIHRARKEAVLRRKLGIPLSAPPKVEGDYPNVIGRSGARWPAKFVPSPPPGLPWRVSGPADDSPSLSA
jgi:hypothetical protein